MALSASAYRATCGGCHQLGAHKAWCPATHGDFAYRLGMAAQAAGDLADTVGPNVPAAANHLYAAASLFHAEAELASQRFKRGSE